MTKPPELITIVDSRDTVIGAEDRQVVHNQGLIYRTAHVIVIDTQGRILSQQRAASRTVNPLKWDWSAAGHVDAGEDYPQAARRELAEEVGITDAKLDFVGKYYAGPEDNTEGRRRFKAVFIGRTRQQPRLDGNEVAAVRWLSLDDLMHEAGAHPENFTADIFRVFDQFGAQLRQACADASPPDH